MAPQINDEVGVEEEIKTEKNRINGASLTKDYLSYS